MDSVHPELSAEINEKQILSDELSAKLRSAIGEYKATAAATVGA
jgi:hypothetical protein